MLSNKIKDLKFRKNFYVKELLKKKLKFLCLKNFNHQAFLKSRYFEVLYFFLKKKNNVFSKSKLVRRCLFTGRGRGSIRTFGVSRSFLREMFQSGVVPGWSKSIW
jgi:ribosomal protein S14